MRDPDRAARTAVVDSGLTGRVSKECPHMKGIFVSGVTEPGGSLVRSADVDGWDVRQAA